MPGGSEEGKLLCGHSCARQERGRVEPPGGPGPSERPHSQPRRGAWGVKVSNQKRAVLEDLAPGLCSSLGSLWEGSATRGEAKIPAPRLCRGVPQSLGVLDHKTGQ